MNRPLIDDLYIGLRLLEERTLASIRPQTVFVTCDKTTTKALHRGEIVYHENIRGSEAFPKLRLQFWDKMFMVMPDVRHDFSINFMPLPHQGAPESMRDMHYIVLMEKVHDFHDDLYPPDKPELRQVKFDLSKYEIPPVKVKPQKLIKSDPDWFRKFDKKRKY